MLVERDAPGTQLTDHDVSSNVVTINTLAWLTYLVSREPAVMQQLAAEADRVLGDAHWAERLDLATSHSYVAACAQETMRMKPVAPILMFETLHETVIGDVSVPAGTGVLALMRQGPMDERYFEHPAIPIGISGNDAVALLTLWVLAFYLCALWLALIRVVREASSWLRPTPLSWRRLAFTITWRPLLAQLQWTLLATRYALAGIELTLAAGDWRCLLGPNGSGKTTLLRCITGQMTPTAGAVRIDAHSLLEAPEKAKRRLGYAHPPNLLPSLLTGRQCLEVYAAAHALSELGHATLDLAARLKLLAALEQPVSSYSLGMRQKLSILLALIASPSLIVLDEAFNGLDPASALVLKRLARPVRHSPANVRMVGECGE